MTYLRIEQSGQAVETVSESLIKKLYDTAIEIPEPEEGEEDNAYMSGHISVPYTYKQYVDYLAGSIGEGTSGVVTSLTQNAEGRFQDLRIDVTNGYYIQFEDPNMISYLASMNIGTNGKVTETEAASVTIIANAPNSTITKFNELKYFTSITESRGGWTGSSDGYARFFNWTALEEVDISNFTSLGHNGGYGYGDAFSGCTSLKKVTASNKLAKIGYRAFHSCSNLEEITGLSGTIDIWAQSFSGCKKLTADSFQNCILNFPGDCGSAFYECRGFKTSLTVDSSNTSLSERVFQRTDLVSISGLDNIESVGNYCFCECPYLKEINMPNAKLDIGTSCGIFIGCTSLKKITLGDCVQLGNAWASYDARGRLFFYNCTSLHTIDVKSLQVVAKSNSNSTFYNCTEMRNFVIRSTTVPTVEDGADTNIDQFGGSNVTIYVPDAAVNDYKTAQGWSNVASYIKGLSEYTPMAV